MKNFSQKLNKKEIDTHYIIQHFIKVLFKAIQPRKIQGTRAEKEKVKLSLFTNDMNMSFDNEA